MKSYQSSTATLRTILADPSLNRAHIDETMDALASATADAKDIDEAIRIGGDMASADAGIDDGELEDELAAMLEEVETEKKQELEKQRALDKVKEPVKAADIPPVSSKDVLQPGSEPIIEKRAAVPV